MIRNIRYSSDLTLRIVTGTTGQSFGTTARVETLDGGEVLYQTPVLPFDSDSLAFIDALRWLEAQQQIVVRGQTHVAPARRFVGRTGSGAGFHVRVDRGEIIRAVAVAEADGKWRVEELVPADSVPAGARAKLGVR